MDFPFRRLAPLKNRASDGKPGPLRWRVPDLIDFDYYVAEDEQRIHDHPAERKRLAERDRRLYKDEIAPTIGDAGAHTTTHRSRALRWWLELRRRQEDPALAELLPGTAFERGQRLVTYTLGIIGFLLGIGVASTLLHYEGDHPVNVSWYLFWLVLVQILLAGTTLSLWYGRRTRVVRGAVQDVSLIGHLIRPVFARVARWMQQQRIAHVSPDLRERAEARKGLVQSNFALYGPAAYLPMLIPAQVFGIGFNIGAILITIALEWFTDLAFGWGSALNVSAGTIHGITHLIALPWSWLFGEGVGLPTLEQVAGTRISLKDPLYVLDAEHLRSWRWFLVLAVLTYGLLPRVILLGLSAHKQRRALAALPFTHQSAQAPYARMITPSLEVRITGTGPGPEMPIPSPLKPLTRPTAAPRPEPAVAPAGPEPVAKTPPPATTETGTRAAEPASATEGAREPRPAEAKRSSAERPSPAPARAPKVAPAAQARTGPAPKAAAAPEPATKTEPAQTRDRAPPSAVPEPAPAPEPPQAPEQPAPPSPGAADTTTEHVTVEADACILLLHIDVADLLEERDHARLQQLLRIQSGWRVAAAATYGGGRAMSEQALELVEAATWHAPPPRVALIQDGSQPPITENLRFLRALRAVTGEQAQVLLALTGDPDDSEDDPLPPLSEFDFIDWQRKIEQMGDPYLRLVTLASADEAEDEDERGRGPVMAEQVPTLAIVGHPNAGKSSVVATLTENDRIAIDKRAGTTTRSDVYPVEIDGQTVLRFIDTPGFQNPTDILEWFQHHEEEIDLASAFVATHGDDRLFSHDCALLKPIADGAGIILVVDGSKRIKEKDRTEMELLRLTGRPRMAILNNLTVNHRHMAAWQDALNKSFNSVREFNAHRATYAERIALLNALKAIDQRWEPMLNDTVRAFERDWDRRIEHSVTSILHLLRKALTYKVVKIVKANELGSDDAREAVRKRLTESLQEGLRKLETEAQDEIRGHFKHHVWNVPPGSLLMQDLFSEEVERHLGLNRHQTVLASAAAGAATGGAIDLGVGGLSFGTGTLIGAGLGGVLGVLGTSQLAKLDIQRTLGVERFTLGPVSNPRFPFILLDRIILYSARAMNWAHGRQAADESAPNRVPDPEPNKKQGFTEALDSEDHKVMAKFFAAARKGKDSPHEARVREIIRSILHALATDRIDSRADL